jgi:hypothetical protein
MTRARSQAATPEPQGHRPLRLGPAGAAREVGPAATAVTWRVAVAAPAATAGQWMLQVVQGFPKAAAARVVRTPREVLARRAHPKLVSNAWRIVRAFTRKEPRTLRSMPAIAAKDPANRAAPRAVASVIKASTVSRMPSSSVKLVPSNRGEPARVPKTAWVIPVAKLTWTARPPVSDGPPRQASDLCSLQAPLSNAEFEHRL